MAIHLKVLRIASMFLAFPLSPIGASPQSPASADASLSAITPAFEVATVKSNTSGSTGSRGGFVKDNFIATNVTLQNLILYQAFNISGSRLVGGPKWLESARFDIDAKMDSATADHRKSLAQEPRIAMTQAMFQQLLAERFQLKTHWEDRDLPVYALVAAKGGLKVQPAKQPELPSRTSVDDSRLAGKNVTMSQLAELLTQEVSDEIGRVVVDRTGVSGTYDLLLTWTPESDGSAGDGRASSNQPSAGPSIFTAIQEQLGLKLESTKGAVKVLVIDHAEMPSEN